MILVETAPKTVVVVPVFVLASAKTLGYKTIDLSIFTTTEASLTNKISPNISSSSKFFLKFDSALLMASLQNS
jgi:hypothetical protein